MTNTPDDSRAAAAARRKPPYQVGVVHPRLYYVGLRAANEAHELENSPKTDPPTRYVKRRHLHALPAEVRAVCSFGRE